MLEETNKDKKNQWINDLSVDELRLVLQENIEENNKLKKMILSGNTRSSIEIIKNTKGVNIDVKIYDEDPDVAKTKAVKIYNELTNEYNQEI
jgi:hypothetical protein